MFRTIRPLTSSSARAIAQSRGPTYPPKAFSTFALQYRRPRAAASPLSAAWRTQYSTKPPVPPTSIDKDSEKKLGQEKLVSDPPAVSTESSVRHVIEPSPSTISEAAKEERDISSGVVQDLKTIKETLALSSVPKEPYFLGLAGTLPYLGTSISTLLLGWNMRTEWPTSSNFINSFLLNPETAASWLHTLEQIQLGYGAVIISFLGAIHWGLEFSEKTPDHDRTRFRYGMGVLAPAAAWPTLFMPVPWALTSQFVTFTALYMADTRASTNGWAPSWYPTYRFVLTAVVGGAIFISLVGRAKSGNENQPFVVSRIEDQMDKTLSKEVAQPYGQKWAKLEEEERVRNRKAKEEEERKKKEEEKKEKKKGGKKDGEKKEEKQGKEGEKQDNDEGDDKGDDEGDDESAEDTEQKDQDNSDDSKDASKDDKPKDKKKSEDKSKSKGKDQGDKKESKDDAEDDTEGDDAEDDGEKDESDGDEENKQDKDGDEETKDKDGVGKKGDKSEEKGDKKDEKKGDKGDDAKKSEKKSKK